MVKTLYVSDLDGTLLHSNERTSAFSNRVINGLVEKGMLFSYATARSLITAKKVTEGLSARIPLIIYNGAFIVDNVTGEILKAMSGCDKVVAFGDGRNDIDMFEAADEGYAVSNADPELKEKATGILLSNDEDGVAKWLQIQYKC